MYTKRIIPCLDVMNNRVVKGTNFVNLRDAGDPVEVGAAYDAAGADELVFLDITASSDNRETVADMVERAIRQKEAALSPSTLRGYKKIYEQQIKPAPIAKVRVSTVSSAHLQKWIGWMLGRGLSPKTVKNAYGLFTSCYQFMGGEKVFRVKFPQASAVRKTAVRFPFRGCRRGTGASFMPGRMRK